METYIVWVSDNLENKLKNAFIASNAAEIATINQRIHHGNSLLRGWIENSTGKVILNNGTMGAAVVPDSTLAQLATLQAQISALWDDTLSFGVSMTLREANRAGAVARERGGNRILWYTPDLDRPQAQTGEAADPLKGLAEGVLKKTTDEFMEVPQEQAPAPAAQEPAPAQGQEAPANDPEQIKNIVMNILQQIKSQKKTLDQLKLQAPDTYKAILGAVQAMIVMARAMTEQSTGGGEEEQAAPQDMSAAQQQDQQQGLQEQAVQNQQEIGIGLQTEMKEHGISEAEALKLVQDHLAEDKQYYTKRQGA